MQESFLFQDPVQRITFLDDVHLSLDSFVVNIIDMPLYFSRFNHMYVVSLFILQRKRRFDGDEYRQRKTDEPDSLLENLTKTRPIQWL
jgi:hypothetical protein